MARKARRSAQEESLQRNDVLRYLCIASVVGIVLLAALLCLVSVVLLLADIAQSAYPYFGIASAAVSTFVSGFLAARKIRKNGLLMGLCAALPALLLLALLVFLLANSFGLVSLLLAAAMLAAAGAGGVAAVNIKKG